MAGLAHFTQASKAAASLKSCLAQENTAKSFSCGRCAPSVKSFAGPLRLKRKAVQSRSPSTGRKSGYAIGVPRAGDRNGEGSTVAESSKNSDMEQELVQQTMLSEAQKKRQVRIQ